MHLLESHGQLLNNIYNRMPWPLLMLNVDRCVVECNSTAYQVLQGDAPIALGAAEQLNCCDRSYRSYRSYRCGQRRHGLRPPASASAARSDAGR